MVNFSNWRNSMELIIALVLFVGLVSCWFVLPGTTSATQTASEKISHEPQPELRTAMQQAA